MPAQKTAKTSSSSSSVSRNNTQSFDDGYETDEQEGSRDFQNISLKERGEILGNVIEKSHFYINREQLLLRRAKNFITIRDDNESIGDAEDDLTEVMTSDAYKQHMQELSLMATTLRPNNKHKSVQHLVDINSKLLLLIDKFQNKDGKSYTWEKKYENLQKVHGRLVRKHRLQIKVLKSKILSLSGNISSKHASEDIKNFFADLNKINGDLVEEDETKGFVMTKQSAKNNKKIVVKSNSSSDTEDDDHNNKDDNLTKLVFTKSKLPKGIFKAAPLDDFDEIIFPSMPMKKRPAATTIRGSLPDNSKKLKQ